MRLLSLALIILTASLAFATHANANSDSLCAAPNITMMSPEFHLSNSWGSVLGWSPLNTNLCKGYFSEPSSLKAVPHPPPFNTTLTTIQATGYANFSTTGISTAYGVTVTQPGRELTADQATLYRNPNTLDINRIELSGHVLYREFGKVLFAPFATIDLENNTATLEQLGAYRISRPSNNSTVSGWGTTNHAFRETNGNLSLKNATYTTCSPMAPSWHLQAQDLYLNKISGRGTAHNTWFYAGHLPIFYTPYANFPIDRRRYSGFLYPTPDYDSDSGFMLNIPYYINLAPNYDETLALIPMTKRGVQFTSLFRFLTTTSTGSWGMAFLPDDRQFASFRQNAAATYGVNANTQPYLNSLNHDSDSRGAFSFKDQSTLNERWSALADINYVTDDYYFQDLGTLPQMVNTDQLINQAQINYQDAHWQWSARTQLYQTLHLINTNFVADQYQRLPEIDLSASYPNQALGLDYAFNSAWVNFQHVDDFFTDEPFPTGNRIHLNPTITRPITRSWGYILPDVEADITGYSVANNGLVNSSGSAVAPAASPSLNQTRALPIVDIDSGLYLDRSLSLFHHLYRQTLEPRAFYLFVPAVNQTQYPIFDTSLPSFSYDQLFRTNRFIGYDRLGDANQISVGITSRLLDDFNGAQKADLSIGEAFYFRKHSVCLYPNCSDDPTIDDQISPVAGRMDLYLSPKWTLTGAAAYDPNQGVMNNYNARVNYKPAPQVILTTGYNYVQNGDVLNSTDDNSDINNLSRIDIGAAFPLSERWSAVSDWNYNISHQHPQTYFYGVEYNTCCWAVRLVANRLLTAENADNSTEFTNKIYVQFMLKGLGSVGNKTGGNLLTSTFSGYVDDFQKQ